jgi:hypothetical protein
MPYPGQLRGENGMGTVELLAMIVCQLAFILAFVGRGGIGRPVSASERTTACANRREWGERHNLDMRGE